MTEHTESNEQTFGQPNTRMIEKKKKSLAKACVKEGKNEGREVDTKMQHNHKSTSWLTYCTGICSWGANCFSYTEYLSWKQVSRFWCEEDALVQDDQFNTYFDQV